VRRASRSGAIIVVPHALNVGYVAVRTCGKLLYEIYHNFKKIYILMTNTRGIFDGKAPIVIIYTKIGLSDF
jgi:hypothetical protein